MDFLPGLPQKDSERKRRRELDAVEGHRAGSSWKMAFQNAGATGMLGCSPGLAHPPSTPCSRLMGQILFAGTIVGLRCQNADSQTGAGMASEGCSKSCVVFVYEQTEELNGRHRKTMRTV